MRDLKYWDVAERARAYGHIALFLILVLCFALCGRAGVRSGVPATAAVLTGHADNFRDAWYAQETTLTPANVAGGTFGQRFSWQVASRVMAQLLIVPDVATSQGTKDLLIVTALSGQISAFDANNWSSSPVWQITMPPGFSKYVLLYSGSGEVTACLATPAADPSNGWLFAVCGSSSQAWTLYKLNVASGATIASAVISAQYPGTGDPNGGDTVVDGELQFLPASHAARADLTIANGNVYVAFASPSDGRPWHGWAMAYSESNLSQTGVWCSTPSSFGGGFWGGGTGFSVDRSGNLYGTTGNGGYDGSTAFGNSYVKLSSTLSLLDWFTPANWATLEADDLDLASSHAIQIPSVNTSLVIGGGKDFRAYALHSSCLGELQGGGSSCPAPQLWYTNDGTPSDDVGIYSGAFGNGTLFLSTVAGPITANLYDPATGLFNETATTSASTYLFPGAQLSYSSNGAQTSTGILWAVVPTNSSAAGSPVAGTMRAFNAVTLSEIYNTDAAAGDALGQVNKYHVPVVWRGHVYVAGGEFVYGYGLGAHS